MPCNGNAECTAKKALSNYEAQKLYSETLRNNAEVCR